MELTGAEIVCESLLKEGVDVVFGLPGGAVLPLYGALSSYPGVRHILVRHEQAAAMAADRRTWTSAADIRYNEQAAQVLHTPERL